MRKIFTTPYLDFLLSCQPTWEKRGSGQWATEIILPLRDRKAFEASQEMLEKITPEMLIFVHGLKRKEPICFLSEKVSEKC